MVEKSAYRNVKFKFARMKPEHIRDVVRIERASFPTPWSETAFHGEMQNDFAFYIVALSRGRVAGYAGMWLILDEAHVTNVAVHSDYRGLGIGRMLMEELMYLSMLAGAGSMTLEVRASNSVAINLYLALGFIQEGRRKGYYNDTDEDALIMWKILQTI